MLKTSVETDFNYVQFNVFKRNYTVQFLWLFIRDMKVAKL